MKGKSMGGEMKRFLLVCMLWLAAVLPAFAEGDDLKISEIVITSKIVKGKPIDSIKRLSASTDKNLYCFTRTVAPAGTETTIKHVWYNGTEKAGEFELPVKGEKWRTYSKKLIQKGWAGDWRVEVLDSSGKLLKSVKFKMN
jgi:hypothetical protein